MSLLFAPNKRYPPVQQHIPLFDFPTRLYSYAALALAGVTGLLLPELAGALLWPVLAVGMVLLGVAHGACDQFVAPACRPALRRQPERYWVRFLGLYLGLAGVVGLLWWQLPEATVALFFGLSVWHWGSADAPAQPQQPGWWLAHSVLRGLLIFYVPAAVWPAATLTVVNGLLTFGGGTTISVAALSAATAGLAPLVIGGHGLLWAAYARHRAWLLVRTDAVEVLLLTGLFVALPPMLSVSVYFVFWHSLQHVLRMNRLLGFAPAAGAVAAPVWQRLGREIGFFVHRALPLLLVSVAAIGVLYWQLEAYLPDVTALFSLALVVASVVTLPHALLVTWLLDATKWQVARRVAAVQS